MAVIDSETFVFFMNDVTKEIRRHADAAKAEVQMLRIEADKLEAEDPSDAKVHLYRVQAMALRHKQDGIEEALKIVADKGNIWKSEG